MGRYNTRESLRESSPATNLVFSRACELFDNGDLNSNCDEIKNDSIFSNSLLMNENNVGIIELKFLLYNNDIEADSYCTSIEVLEPVSDEEIIKIDNNLKLRLWQEKIFRAQCKSVSTDDVKVSQLIIFNVCQVLIS